jgi:hypothetical protein
MKTKAKHAPRTPPKKAQGHPLCVLLLLFWGKSFTYKIIGAAPATPPLKGVVHGVVLFKKASSHQHQL